MSEEKEYIFPIEVDKTFFSERLDKNKLLHDSITLYKNNDISIEYDEVDSKVLIVTSVEIEANIQKRLRKLVLTHRKIDVLDDMVRRSTIIFNQTLGKVITAYDSNSDYTHICTLYCSPLEVFECLLMNVLVCPKTSIYVNRSNIAVKLVKRHTDTVLFDDNLNSTVAPTIVYNVSSFYKKDGYIDVYVKNTNDYDVSVCCVSMSKTKC